MEARTRISRKVWGCSVVACLGILLVGASPARADDCNGNGIDDAVEAASGGLVGYYYGPDNTAWEAPYNFARIDATVDFPNPFTPGGTVGTDFFSVRWVGSLVSTATGGTYTLIVEHDDGFRLYLDGVLLMGDDGSDTHSTIVMLDASTEYHIRLEYFENLFEQKCILRWIPPGGSEELIPTENLRAIYDRNLNGVPDECEFGDCNNNLVPDSVDVTGGLSTDCDENGVPDECQSEDDCDQNGVLDWCELNDYGLLGAYYTASGATTYGPHLFLPENHLGTRIDAPNYEPYGDVFYFPYDGVPFWQQPYQMTDTQTPNITVRWTGYITVDYSETYIFYLTGNDRAKLWVDETLIGDIWTSACCWHSACTPIDLEAGVQYPIVLEFADASTMGYIGLEWSSNSVPQEWVPNTVFSPMVDLDGNGIPDVCDVDCNNNGVSDDIDIANGTSADCNVNGIPDECELPPICPDCPDCNNNGVPDDCDVASGASFDCDNDGVPDECQLAGNDCNANGIPDNCDIASGSSDDCNGNGVPDECDDCNGNGIPDVDDIALGTSEDCNANCVPDECDILPPPWDYGQAHWRFEEATGNTVLDSGLNRLDGTLNALPIRTTDVPVDPVPQSGFTNIQSLDLNWQSTSSGGFFTAADTGGALTMGDQDFTVEAWVKLDYLSNTSGSNERQYLCQKKPLPSQDDQIDYAILVQRGNNGPSPNYGKTAGFTGRELQLYFGTDSSTWSITSNLEITDFDWHFVSVAYDTSNNVVRFGIDDTFETLSFNDNPRTTNGGSLRVGSHQNGQGTDNFFLRGMIDELRVSRRVVPVVELLNAVPVPTGDCQGDGIPDDCQLEGNDCNANGLPDECELAGNDCNANGVLDSCDIASGTSTDCDGNGVPDECELDGNDCNANGVFDACDILYGTSTDCNGNGIPDECDIASGMSEDCQPDGLPDECQLSPFVYAWDDGEADISVQTDGNYQAWLNQFTVRNNLGTITDVDITFGSTAVGQPVTLYLWNDPDGDGDPTDATVLASWSLTIEPGMDNPVEFSRIDIPDTYVGPNGTSFFVGAVLDVPVRDMKSLRNSIYPAAANWDEPTMYSRSWLVGTSGPVNPNDLTAGAVEFGLFEDLLPPGNWCVRAVPQSSGGDCNGNGIPDDCDIADGTSEDSNNNGVPDECEFAGTYYVPDDFGTIQSAINAVLVEGSTIIVRPGTYPENLDFLGKAVEVRSELGPDVTTVNGGGNGSVVAFQSGEGPDSILAGFTLTGGSGESGLGGGGVFCWESSPTIRDNTIAGNSTNDFGGGILVYGAAMPVILDNRIEGNFSDSSGGAIYAELFNTTIRIEKNRIVNNIAGSGGYGSGIACVNGTLALLGNEISGNVGADSGGGVFVFYSGAGQHRIESNEIRDNQASDDGGGLWFASAGDIVIANNLFEGNSAPYGGAIYARDGGTLASNTIVNNSATSQGGGLYYDDSGGDLLIVNSILRGNSAPTSPDIEYPDGGSSISYSNIGGGWSGTGNLDVDPLFVDAGNGDYRLGSGSPCIDAADDTAIPLDVSDLDGDGDTSERIPLDLAGLPRFVNHPNTPDTGVADPPEYPQVVDIGAYEFGIPGDLDGDCDVDLSDLVQLLANYGTMGGAAYDNGDIDGDGDVDLSDLAALLSDYGDSCP